MQDRKTAGYSVSAVRGSGLRLDGGAMFGVVPKALWRKKTEPDSRNRISLSTDPLLLTGNGKTILVEGSTSFTFGEKEKDIYGMTGEGLAADLARKGCSRESVDLVVVTHLHFDHAGGLVTKNARAELEPTFPNARIVVQKTELDDALSPPDIRAASYKADDIKLLCEAGLFSPVEGAVELEDGIRVEPTPGHTRGHQIVMIGRGAETLVFVGDLIPTSAHINPAWLMAYDLSPVDCVRERRKLLEKAAAEEWTLYFYHDPKVKAGRVTRNEKGRYDFHPLS